MKYLEYLISKIKFFNNKISKGGIGQVIYTQAMVGFLEPHTLYAENTIYLFHKINCYLFLIWPLVFTVLILTLILDSSYLRLKLSIYLLNCLELRKGWFVDLYLKLVNLGNKEVNGFFYIGSKEFFVKKKFVKDNYFIQYILSGLYLWTQSNVLEYAKSNWGLEIKNNDILVDDVILQMESSEFANYEIVLTITPVLILILIFIESGLTVYAADAESQISSFINVKVIGAQWYWVYDLSFDVVGYKEVTDNISVRTLESVKYNFVSNLVNESDLALGDLRMLQVDNILYLPVNIPVKFNITSRDVLHSFALPTAGWKMDAVPGRLNEMMFVMKQPGIHVGMCSELCGVGHSAMPIMIHVLPVSEFLKVYGVTLKIY